MTSFLQAFTLNVSGEDCVYLAAPIPLIILQTQTHMLIIVPDKKRVNVVLI